MRGARRRERDEFLRSTPRRAATSRSTATLRGEPAPTLLSLLDACGDRRWAAALLRRWLTHPLRAQDAAAARHAGDRRSGSTRAGRAARLRARARAHRRHRAHRRRASRSLSARPRDLAGLRDTLAAAAGAVGGARRPATATDGALLLATLAGELAVDPRGPTCSPARSRRAAALLRDGGVIATGFDAELDELRAIDEHCGEFLLELEARERERTGIANLKVEYNRVHGFYIEVTHAHRPKVPDDYRRRQTVKNAERYITPELKTFEDKVLSRASARWPARSVLYERLLADLAPSIPALQRAAAALAALDVLATLAERAETLGLARPAFVADDRARDPRRPPPGGRAADRRTFVPNDLDADAGAADAGRHRAQHGRQVDLHAAGGADRAARALRQRRAGDRAPTSGRSTRSSRASAPPTTSPAGARRSWSR